MGNAITDRPAPALDSWNQMAGEAPIEYKKFAFYLSLGLGRTVRAAAMSWQDQTKTLDELAEASEAGYKSTQAAINDFNRLATKWQWQGRADQHDLSVMSEEMKSVRNKLAGAIIKMADKIASSIDEIDYKPESMKEVLDNIHAIIDLLPTPQESSATVRRAHGEPKLLGRSV